MSIQINVTAKCQATTQRGTKCTKEATRHEPLIGAWVDGVVELVDTVKTKKQWRPERTMASGHVFPGAWVETTGPMLGMPTHGFVCNTHSRDAVASRARRAFGNYGYRGR